jgi:hypothetical protein
MVIELQFILVGFWAAYVAVNLYNIDKSLKELRAIITEGEC